MTDPQLVELFDRLRDRTDHAARLASSVDSGDATAIKHVLTDANAWLSDVIQALGSLLASPALADADAYTDLAKSALNHDYDPSDLATQLKHAVSTWAPRQPNLSVWLMLGQLDFTQASSHRTTELLHALLISPNTTATQRATLVRQSMQAPPSSRPSPWKLFERAMQNAASHVPLARTLLRHAPELAGLVLAFETQDSKHRTHEHLDQDDLAEFLTPYLEYLRGQRSTTPLGDAEEGDAFMLALLHPNAPTDLAAHILEALLHHAPASDDPIVQRRDNYTQLSAALQHHLLKDENESGDARELLLDLLAENPTIVQDLAAGSMHTFGDLDILELLERGVDPIYALDPLDGWQRARIIREHTDRLPDNLTINPDGMQHHDYLACLEAIGWDQAVYEEAAIRTWPDELVERRDTSSAALERIAKDAMHRRATADADKLLTRALKHPNTTPAILQTAQVYLRSRTGRFQPARPGKVSGPATPPAVLRACLEAMPDPTERQELLDHIEQLSHRSYHHLLPHLKTRLPQPALLLETP